MKKVILSLFVIGTIANAQENTNLPEGSGLYMKCVGCHGIRGEKSALGKSGIIGGMKKEELIKSISAYQEGKLNKYGLGNLMKGQVANLTDQEIATLSDYISGLTNN